MDCCKKEKKGLWSGLLYGLIPHTGCIAFIIFTILGITTAASLFRPLLLNRYFFHGLIALSFAFATLSAGIYLKKREMLSLEGIKKKKGYLSILYGTSIGVNILLFFFIFPFAANLTAATPLEGSNSITLSVDIPCPGHAPLITEELKTVESVNSVIFKFPNNFEVSYSGNQEDIMNLEIFEIYKAQQKER